MRYALILVILLLLIGAVMAVYTGKVAIKPSQDIKPVPQTPATNPSPSPDEIEIVPPIIKAALRVTKKHFGTYVSPANSPVQPERFSGYHTGADFETFPDEQSSDVSVHAICDGTLILKEYAQGYGGVAVQSCTLNNQPVTVIYGHIRLSSIEHSVGDVLNAGQTIGVLGTGYSAETDGERKHLHLGIHKGSSVNILGYVQSQAALSDWEDPCSFVCHN